MTIAAKRYNNPGNVSLPIRGWTGGGSIVGIKGQSGYAAFSSMDEGVAALKQRLSTRLQDGYTTIGQLNSVYAEDPNWKNAVSKFSGIGVNDTLDPNNSEQMNALTGGIIRQETGLSPSALGINLASDPAVTPGVEASPTATGEYDFNTGGVYSWTGDPKTDPAFQTAAATDAASKAASGIDAASEGQASSVARAIVTAGNQQAQTTADALKGVAETTAETAKAALAANQASDATWKGWLTNRLLQIVVFIIAFIFIAFGLYAFARNNNVVLSPA